MRWRRIWQRLLSYLCRDEDLPELSWQADVGATYAADDALPADAAASAINRSVAWFGREAVYSIDWKKGAIEGFEAQIDHQGRQLRRTWPRADCIAEIIIPVMELVLQTP